MRPLLSVVLVPSTPMNDERLSTAGSSRMTRCQRLLPRGHCLERDRLRRFGDPENDAGVLNRKESFRHEDVQQHGQRSALPSHDQRGLLMIQDPEQAFCHTRQWHDRTPLRVAIEGALFRFPLCRNNLAHIIGVSVRDTTAEIRMVTLSVTANSRNSRPPHPP